MKPIGNLREALATMLSVGVVALAALGSAGSWAGDQGDRESLFVGETSDNTVRQFDAKTGKSEGIFVASRSGGLNGPRGLIFGPRVIFCSLTRM